MILWNWLRLKGETKNNQNFKKLSSTIDVAILNPGKQPDFSFDTQNHPLLFYLTTLGEMFAQLVVLRKGNFNTMIYSENQSSSCRRTACTVLHLRPSNLVVHLHLHLPYNEKTFHWYLRILISQENYFIYVVADSL